MTIVPGTRLGRYEIRSQIGEGGMGQVYLAGDTQLDRRVALKILPADFASNRDRMERFVREAKSAAALNHPHIAHVYEIGESDGTHFIAMEFIDGETLREKIHKETAPLSKLLKYLKQAAEGLSKAHAAGIVHRDLKPDNIMVTSDGHAKILDFGLVKLIEPQPAPGIDSGSASEDATAILQLRSTPGVIMGTFGYMSPEQAQGKTVDQRSDIFSFGCILYEAATRRTPFEGDSSIDTLHKIIYATPSPITDFNPAAPADFLRIVRRCLAKDPDKRYQTIRDVANDLEDLRREMASKSEAEWSAPSRSGGISVAPDVSTGSPQVAHATSSAEYIVNEIKRHKTAALLALLVVAGVGLAYAAYRFPWQMKSRVAHFQNMKITSVTNEGNVGAVTISPDGKYIAYSLRQAGTISLWTKHLASGSRVQIVPTTQANRMQPSAFTPDGSYVYYIFEDEQNPQGTLYQVPVLGGPSRKILSEIQTTISLSPDGKQFSFGRVHFGAAVEYELLLANSDGTNVRRLLSVKEPEGFGADIASWSPDGKLLAVAYGNREGGEHMTIATISIADGTVKPLTSQRWLSIIRIVWFPDGSGLAFTAIENSGEPQQIWQMTYPGGEARRITNDLNAYSSGSLSFNADGSALIAVQTETTANIWLAPNGAASRATVIASRKNTSDGSDGLGWTPDGRIVYSTNVNGQAGVAIMKTDGSDQKPLTEGATDAREPEVSPDGRYVCFRSLRTGQSQVWRMDIDGGNPKQLTEGKGAYQISISPDSKWVIFSLFEGGVWRASIEGGTPTKVSDYAAGFYPQVSPNGKLLAIGITEGKTKRPQFAVVTTDGAPFKTIDAPMQGAVFHWFPDGQSLVFVKTIRGVSNLWRQPLDGRKPEQITNFKSDLIFNFAYSLDGRQLALSRGNQSGDAVMISELK
jgi:serine/threonine protein kinase